MNLFKSTLVGAVAAFLFATSVQLVCAAESYDPYERVALSQNAKKLLKDKKILFIERKQYLRDHHNTATLFMYGEINQGSYTPGGAMRVFDVNTGEITTLIELKDGIVRDPEISFDGTKILFSMRKSLEDSYHIYEMNVDGSDMRQLTFAEGVADIDPIYLPDGDIIFASTRQPKYCMCNRHIMANLYRMEGDGANITQLGVSTLFEGHPTLLPDGRVIYDRWEYVDRNFGDAQGLWTMNPDGTKHSIYYGNNMSSPGGVIDAQPIPGTDEVMAIFGSCHERPWGALVILDRKMGVDGEASVKQIWPADSRKYIDKGNWDAFKIINTVYEDPHLLDKNNFLVSRSIWIKKSNATQIYDERMGIYWMNRNGVEELLIQGTQSLFDPMIIAPREMPAEIPTMRDHDSEDGVFYVQNVYEGTHMEGVEKGTVKYLRLIESPEKRTWTVNNWQGQGAQAPAINWSSFEVKKIIGDVEVEADGSVNFRAPAGKHLYFQLLDKDRKMIQSMRSGVSLMPGETNGCIGCHEDRLQLPTPGAMPLALKKAPKDVTLPSWMGKEPKTFSYMEMVQPILDKNCVKCHDYDQSDRKKLVLAGDKDAFFNASYVNMYVSKSVSLVGGGPAQIQGAYSWGSNASKLSKIIENGHKGVKLSEKDRQVIYAWMDLNGVYYPVYETSLDNKPGGRSPLTEAEMKELVKLTGVDFFTLGRANTHIKVQSQLSFDRPEQSVCLDKIRGDKEKYARAVELIKLGGKRLKQTPRGDIEKALVPCELNQQQLAKYAARMADESVQNSVWINTDEKRYDKR